MKPKVTVIIPCKDRPEKLHRALASVSAQTVLPLEVIVVDDGSDVPLQLTHDGYRVPVRIIRQTNQGPSAARNRGVREATGDWIALLDSDDTWLPAKLETQVGLIAQHADAGVCACDMLTRGRAGVAFPLAPHGGQQDGIVEDTLGRLLPGCYIHTSGVMFRKDVFAKVGGFDERLWYCEDRDLWLRLAAATKWIATTKVLTEYFREGDNLSDHENTPLEAEAGVYILKKMLVNNLFDARVKNEAAKLLAQTLHDLSYLHRKKAQPVACCRAAVLSLRRGGAVIPNLKNLTFCWPEALRLLPRRFARQSPAEKQAAFVRAIPKIVAGQTLSPPGAGGAYAVETKRSAID
ncbi:MAG: glycosyltransferase family 2 protein [Pyrinomonadaceae bacterium]